MKQYTHSIAIVVALAGGLAWVSSAQAQPVTGDATLDNVPPGSVTAYYGSWASQPFPTTVSDGPAGLEISSINYGSLYYALPAPLALDPSDNSATLVMTVNNADSPAGANYWLGIPFGLNDNTGNTFYGGYAGKFGFFNSTSGTGGTAVWNGDTVTETIPLTAGQEAAISAGGDSLYSINLELDPAVLPAGPPIYDVTFNSLTLSHVPDESSTLALAGSAAAFLLAFRGRSKK
jgi:hypothetical protein